MRRRDTAPPAVRTLRPQHRAVHDDVRLEAARVVERTLASLAPADVFLESAVASVDERDQGLLLELVLGTLRWLRRLDHVLAAASNRPLDAVEPALRAPLRIAAYQLLFLDRVPAHAVVDEAVEHAHQLTHRGGASFVNAVLRRVARTPELAAWPVEERDPVRRLAIEWSHPDFLVGRWLGRFGESTTRRLLQTNNRPKPLQVLAFRDRGGRELLGERLIEEGLEVQASMLSPLGLTVRHGNPLRSAAFAAGDLYVQDEASQAAALLPPPRPGERVADLAAAPGGKSFALLAWEPSLRLAIGDVDLGRALLVRQNLRRLRRAQPIVVQDAGEPALAAGFDRVVLDLPCTGTGTLRRHPEIKWRLSPDEVERLAAQGLRLARGAASLLRRGGRLVAITCSIEAEENERMVERFLAAAPDFAPVPLAAELPEPLAAAVAGPGRWQVLPADEHDGFTVHVLARRG
jgi:16S rRNA (cytosine967-C5)-methyltransferase